MNWDAFEASAPTLAAIGRPIIEATDLLLLGTLRPDGSPRISPCEAYIVDEDLLLGMMWRSRKALDLLRDPRLAAHTTQADKSGTGGDFKLYGVAVDVPDPARRERYGDRLEAEIDWRPTEPYHLFALDIRQAGFIRFGDGAMAMRWDPEQGERGVRHPDQ